MDPPPNGELSFDGGQGLAAAGLWAWVERAGRLGKGRGPIGLSSCACEARGTRFSLIFPSCLPGGDSAEPDQLSLQVVGPGVTGSCAHTQ